MKKYTILDLFCGGGGCAKGYDDGGFEKIYGVDIEQRDNYPYKFIKGDALEFLRDNVTFIANNVDFIHASPPCQRYTRLKNLSGKTEEEWNNSHVDLVDPTREWLDYYWEQYGIPYVIENVVGAPLRNPIQLCGSQFDGLYTQRPRLFESSIELKTPSKKVTAMGTGKLGTISESGSVSVCGNHNLKGCNDVQTRLYYGFALGGIDWMSTKELTQCVPPKYTEFIGKQIINYLDKRNDLSEIIKTVLMEDRQLLSSFQKIYGYEMSPYLAAKMMATQKIKKESSTTDGSF